MTASGRRGRLYVISGPSGVGKGTVVRALSQRIADLHLSVSVTTRAPRPGELDGVDYHFVDDATFERMVEREELLEWAHVHRQRSGTPRRWVESRLADGCDVLLEIDVQGALQVRERLPEAVLIFLAPPSKDELVRRLSQRGTETAEEQAVRQADAERELAAADAFDHVVINDQLDSCVEQVARLVRAGRRG